MNKQNLAIRLCHFIKRKKWCFKYGGACGTCGSYEVIELLKKINAQKLEKSLLDINKTTPMALEYAEDIYTLLSFLGKLGKVSNLIDTQTIRNHWRKYSVNTSDCIYTKMLKGNPIESFRKKRDKSHYGFDGRSKYDDSKEEIFIRQEWYNR